MTYRVGSDYYVPKTKKDLIRSIKPLWDGKKSDLYEMSVVRLRAIFHTLRRRAIDNLMKKTFDKQINIC